jgi:hypothetical protein
MSLQNGGSGNGHAFGIETGRNPVKPMPPAFGSLDTVDILSPAVISSSTSTACSLPFPQA